MSFLIAGLGGADEREVIVRGDPFCPADRALLRREILGLLRCSHVVLLMNVTSVTHGITCRRAKHLPAAAAAHVAVGCEIGERDDVPSRLRPFLIRHASRHFARAMPHLRETCPGARGRGFLVRFGVPCRIRQGLSRRDRRTRGAVRRHPGYRHRERARRRLDAEDPFQDHGLETRPIRPRNETASYRRPAARSFRSKVARDTPSSRAARRLLPPTCSSTAGCARGWRPAAAASRSRAGGRSMLACGGRWSSPVCSSTGVHVDDVAVASATAACITLDSSRRLPGHR